MKRFLQFTLIAQFIISGSSFLMAQSQDVEWVKVEKSDYSLALPGDWEYQVVGDEGVALIAIAPFDREKDSFKENLTLVIDKKESEIDLKEYALRATDPVLETLKDSHVRESRMTTVNDYPCYVMAYSGIQGETTLMFFQYYFAHKGAAYTVTFAGEYSYQKKYEEVFAKMIAEFSFN